MSRASVDRNFGSQIAGDSISPYLVGINSRVQVTTHSQRNQEKISLKPLHFHLGHRWVNLTVPY
ncbi:hypothetical protein QUA81_25810 [Microcoleus sp. F6_B4]